MESNRARVSPFFGRRGATLRDELGSRHGCCGGRPPCGRSGRSLACLTDWVPKRRAAMTHRQIVGFGWAAAVLVLVLVFLQTRGGTVQAVGFVVGLPVILVLLVIALRMVRSRG